MCHAVLWFTFLVLCHCLHILFLVSDLTLEIYTSPDFVSFPSLNSQFEFSSQTACLLSSDSTPPGQAAAPKHFIQSWSETKKALKGAKDIQKSVALICG